jgi:hypothetical protein
MHQARLGGLVVRLRLAACIVLDPQTIAYSVQSLILALASGCDKHAQSAAAGLSLVEPVSAMDENSLKTATLFAIHKHIAVKCRDCNAAWLKCKQEHADPKECISVGSDVLKCVHDLCAPRPPCLPVHSLTSTPSCIYWNGYLHGESTALRYACREGGSAEFQYF